MNIFLLTNKISKNINTLSFNSLFPILVEKTGFLLGLMVEVFGKGDLHNYIYFYLIFTNGSYYFYCYIVPTIIILY